MPDLTEGQIATMLESQGYRVPPADLSEITHRLNALVEGLKDLDRLEANLAEPWPTLYGRQEPR